MDLWVHQIYNQKIKNIKTDKLQGRISLLSSVIITSIVILAFVAHLINVSKNGLMDELQPYRFSLFCLNTVFCTFMNHKCILHIKWQRIGDSKKMFILKRRLKWEFGDLRSIKYLIKYKRIECEAKWDLRLNGSKRDCFCCFVLLGWGEEIGGGGKCFVKIVEILWRVIIIFLKYLSYLTGYWVRAGRMNLSSF